LRNTKKARLRKKKGGKRKAECEKERGDKKVSGTWL